MVKKWILCPDCKLHLHYTGKEFICKKCKRKFKKIKGVLSLLSKNTVAKSWERIELPLVLGDRGRRYRLFLQFLSKHKDLFKGRVLEIGADVCGISAMIKDRTKAKFVVAVDKARNILERGVKVAPVLGKKPDFIIQADIENLPFTDNFFDVIVDSSSIHHTDISKAIREVSRCLKKGGYLFCFQEPVSSSVCGRLYWRIRKRMGKGPMVLTSRVYSVRRWKRELKRNNFREIQITFCKDTRVVTPTLLNLLYYKLLNMLPNIFIAKFLFGKATIVARK